MSGDSRVRQLLEEILDSGLSPEEVCRDEPEMLPQVRQGLGRVRRVEAQVDALLPPASPTGAGSWSRSSVKSDAEPPVIPGYEVREELGRGGMSVVYRAWDQRLHRFVAIKLLLSGSHALPEERERFRRGAEAKAGLRHPNIAQVHDIGDLDGQPYLIMEYVEGGSLAQRLAGAPLPASQAAGLLATLAEAVQAAHDCGVIHRDLKPSNVLLTVDEIPKIIDFGLARRLDDGPALTHSGATLGTPSYMAPEQALGETDAVGPATDVYGLGATLYECLTGRPPFRAETSTATLHQVVVDEPVRPALLNPRVPRDLQTICLKCLAKEPTRRYASARALAEDLLRFERGEPIRARPVGAIERVARWARRRPALAAALATGALLATALVVIVVSAHVQRTALRAAATAYAEADLNEAERLRNRGEFEASAAVLQRARDRLRDYVSHDLHDRLSAALADLQLMTRLERIRLSQAPLLGEPDDSDLADREYEAAFREARLAEDPSRPDETAARIRASGVRSSLVAALDDWAVRAPTSARRAWCLDVARRADPDADGWSRRARDPEVWQDPKALAELASSAPLKRPSLSLLVALGWRLNETGGDATPLFRRLLEENPGDFWLNLQMGNALIRRDPDEAIGYFRAAMAVRPTAVIVANNLAVALRAVGQLDEAIGYYERALRLDPAYAPAHNNLGLVLRDQGKLEEAQASFEKAIELDPQFLHAHMNLGNLLRRREEPAKAIECYERAARLDPGNAAPHYSIGLIMAEQGRTEEAIQHYQQALRADRRFYRAHNNLGRLLIAQGRLDEAIEHLQAAVGIEPGDALSQRNLSLAFQKKGMPGQALFHRFQSYDLEKDYAAAARSYAEAIESDPNLAADLQAGHRYRAARAAALASRSGEADGPTVGEEERARWRQRAYEWLRCELAAWSERLESASPAEHVEIRRSLARWRDDFNLAGLHEPDDLERLSPAERQNWRSLWDEVDAIVRPRENTE